ncbi:MAG: CvpA family protein [Sulfurimonadaceae bacterium]|nr:CvpA family protein [Sulfurimonadaceae bacterium]
MELNYFDLIVGVIILLLGLKGILNGFFKELFGLIGIIGGIFVASRAGDAVGQFISDLVFKFENEAAISFTGFLVTLAVFWLLAILAGNLFKKLSAESGLGPIDRIFGFVFGSGKFFLIVSVIVYAMFNVNAIRKNLEPAMENSILFGVMVATGDFIMKIDPVEIADDVNESVEQVIEKGTETVNDIAEDAVKENAEAVIEEVQKQIEITTTPKDEGAQ